MPIDPVTGSIIASVGSSLVGGLFGGKQSAKDRYGAGIDQINLSKRAFDAKMQMGKKHGIHPLVMAGGSLPQVSTVHDSTQTQNMGQNIAQAVGKGATSYFQNKQNQQMNQLSLERAALENDLLRSQISSINNPPAGTSAGYANTITSGKRVDMVPDKQVYSRKNDTGVSAGLKPAFMEVDIGKGQTALVPYTEEGYAEGLEALPSIDKFFKQREIQAKRIFGPSAEKLKRYNKRKDKKLQERIKKLKSQNAPWYKY